MINQLLDLSRLESGKLDLHPVPGELSGFLGRLAGSFASLFESRGIAYGYTAPLQPVWVAIDGANWNSSCPTSSPTPPNLPPREAPYGLPPPLSPFRLIRDCYGWW
jgi:signal transduction histidine kinase